MLPSFLWPDVERCGCMLKPLSAAAQPQTLWAPALPDRQARCCLGSGIPIRMLDSGALAGILLETTLTRGHRVWEVILSRMIHRGGGREGIADVSKPWGILCAAFIHAFEREEKNKSCITAAQRQVDKECERSPLSVNPSRLG